MKKTLFIFAVIFHLCAFSLCAFDFGLVLSQDTDISVYPSDSDRTDFDISGILMPRFTTPLGNMGRLYISAAIGFKNGPFAIIPELTRTDVSLNFGNVNLNVGRMFYSDPLGITADGLFDGARVSFNTRNGDIRIGGWYTGLLYRDRASITMTPNELKSSNVEINYDDFANTYFAPKRFLAALEYDHPSIAGFIELKTSILTQYDLSDDNLNSHYLTFALTVPGKKVVLDLGGCFELIDYKDKITPAFAADVGFTYILPTKLERHIKLSARYSSGVSEDETFGAFLPITTITQGEIPEAKFSGLSMLSLDFTGRLAKLLSANLSFTYFVRNDKGTYRYYPVTEENLDGFFLGAEVFGRFIWTLSSEIRLNVGTGVFLPMLGDVAPEADILWRTKLNLAISLY